MALQLLGHISIFQQEQSELPRQGRLQLLHLLVMVGIAVQFQLQQQRQSLGLLGYFLPMQTTGKPTQVTATQAFTFGARNWKSEPLPPATSQYSEAGSIVLRTAASGVAANNTIGTSVANTFIKTAFGYGSGSTSASDNGTVITTTTQALPSTLTAAYIGAGATAATGQSVTIKKIAYYPLRVTNAQLQGLTS